jgi:hypothetical protein
MIAVISAIIGGWAAGVATAALWLQARSGQTRVEVRLQRMTLAAPGQDPKPVALFRLINHSAHRVKVTHVGLGPIRKGGMHIFIPHPLPLPAPGPFEIEARDSVQVYIEPEQLADGDPRWKTRALIATSDDRKFESKKVRVRDLIEGA